MPIRDIPVVVLQEKNQLATLGRFIWLYEVDVPTDPVTRYRLVRSPESVSFRGQTYSPFPITHAASQLSSSGDLPSVQVTISNVSREIISTLENYEGLIGQPAKIILVHSLSLGPNGQSVAEEPFEIITSSADAASATFTLGSRDLWDMTIPASRIMKNSCRHQYKNGACGYALDTSDANYLSSCDKTLHGPNGCNAHGASYTAAGFTPIHPHRFGGFPGIPTPTTAGGI